MAGRIVLVFHSTHHVLSAEEVLERAGIDFDIVPLPEGLRAGCGMAIELDADYESRSVKLISEAGVVCAGVYES